MLVSFYSTLLEYTVKTRQSVAGLFNKSSFRNWALITLIACLISVNIFAIFNTRSVNAADGYVLDRVIQWADGSTEHVQIDSDYFFILDGQKKKLVGMVLSSFGLPYGEDGQFYLDENLALFDNELTYLESVGVRVISVSLRYIRWEGWMPTAEEEEQGYRNLLDLLYQHKMLVIPGLFAKSMPGMSSLENPDFSWGANSDLTDTMSAWTERWTSIISSYPNVVTIIAENELDCPSPSQEFTPSRVTDYLNLLRNIMTQRTDTPVITKIWRNQDMHPELKEACLNFTDFLSLNVYAANSNLMDDLLNSYFQWMDGAGFSYPSWWCLELNQGATEEISPGDWEWRHDVNKFDVSYIESVFNHGASVVTLFPSNWEAMPSAQFFDSEGNPVPKLTEIAGELERLQATIATIECPSVIVTANAGQITTTGAILNGSLDDIGTDDEVLVSFEWGTNPGSYTFETEAQTLQNTGTFSTTITGLNPGTMYYYRAKGIGDSVCYGEEKSFSTIATQIAVTTNEAAAITSESARLTGTLEQIDAASDVNVSFMWSEAVRSLDFETAVQTVNETGEFYIDLQELKPDTTYYYQAKAVGESTVYGDILSFTTRSVSPLVETVYVDDLTGSSVTLNGSLNNLGSASEVTVSFEWGTSSGNYSNETTPETMTTAGTFSFSLDGLNSDSTYYYRAKAIGNGTSYGVEKDFIPPAISTEPPIAATYDATNINESSAQLKGSLENTGTAETIQVYFQYSDSPGEYNEEILVQEMAEEGTFDYILGGLNAGATYYFRTKAIGDGTSYGEEKSFTTTEESTTAPDRPIILSMKTSVILKWNAVDGATNYILQVSTSPDCSSEYIFNEDVGKTTKQKVKGLTVDRTYYWRLKAGNSSGFSDWSPIWSFTIQ